MKWIEIEVVTTPQATEAVIGVMYEMDITGVSIADPRDLLANKRKPSAWDYVEDELKNVDFNKVVIKAYLSENENYGEKISMLKEKLGTIAEYFDIGNGEIQQSEVYEKDWANQWKKYYKPVNIAEGIVIKPTWEPYQPQNENEIIIEMDPGMAFGTGTHETTKMCVQLLQKYAKIDNDVLDVGCGSGILGIAALKLGAKSCLSVDIDADAVRVTGENGKVNQVIDQMTVKEGNLLDVVSGQFDVITANIIADAIIVLSEMISPYLKANGVFIASGIIQARYDEVKDKLLSQGFKIEEELLMGEWVAVAVKR